MATAAEATTIAEMSYALECELWPEQANSLELQQFMNAAQQLLTSNPNFWAFVAVDETDSIVGMLTLNECAAIYAGGLFGEIAEMHIASEVRSQGVGKMLIEAAVEHGRGRNWPFLEVGAPSLDMSMTSSSFALT